MSIPSGTTDSCEPGYYSIKRPATRLVFGRLAISNMAQITVCAPSQLFVTSVHLVHNAGVILLRILVPFRRAPELEGVIRAPIWQHLVAFHYVRLNGRCNSMPVVTSIKSNAIFLEIRIAAFPRNVLQRLVMIGKSVSGGTFSFQYIHLPHAYLTLAISWQTNTHRRLKAL